MMIQQSIMHALSGKLFRAGEESGPSKSTDITDKSQKFSAVMLAMEDFDEELLGADLTARAQPTDGKPLPRVGEDMPADGKDLPESGKELPVDGKRVLPELPTKQEVQAETGVVRKSDATPEKTPEATPAPATGFAALAQMPDRPSYRDVPILPRSGDTRPRMVEVAGPETAAKPASAPAPAPAPAPTDAAATVVTAAPVTAEVFAPVAEPLVASASVVAAPNVSAHPASSVHSALKAPTSNHAPATSAPSAPAIAPALVAAVSSSATRAPAKADAARPQATSAPAPLVAAQGVPAATPTPLATAPTALVATPAAAFAHSLAAPVTAPSTAAPTVAPELLSTPSTPSPALAEGKASPDASKPAHQPPASQAQQAPLRAGDLQLHVTKAPGFSQVLERKSAITTLTQISPEKRIATPVQTAPKPIGATGKTVEPGTSPSNVPAPQISVAISTPSPSAPAPQVQTPALQPPAPQTIETLVERLAQAREAAQPTTARLSVANSDFGTVSLRFDNGAAGLSVAMTNADPEFAATARTALAERAVAAGETPRAETVAQGQNSSHNTGQNTSQTAGQSLGQQSTQSQMQHNGNAPQDRFQPPAADAENRRSSRDHNGTQTPPNTAKTADTGLYI